MTIADDFAEFHRANPQVYRRLRELAFALKARGRRKCGIAMLFEVLRWEHYMETDDPASDFKLNNSYRALYARKLMREEPSLDGFFDVRALRDAQGLPRSDALDEGCAWAGGVCDCGDLPCARSVADEGSSWDAL